MSHLSEPQSDCNDVSVNIAEMLAAADDDSDALVAKAVRDVLQGNPLEESWCQRVVDRRPPESIPQLAALHKQDLPKIPFEIATHLGTPIRLANGEIYGTLCLSFGTSQTVQLRDMKSLKFTAQMRAKTIDSQRHTKVHDTQAAALFH